MRRTARTLAIALALARRPAGDGPGARRAAPRRRFPRCSSSGASIRSSSRARRGRGPPTCWAVLAVNRRPSAQPASAERTWLFFGGLAAIGVALASPIEAYEGSLFSVHMVQHLLLMLRRRAAAAGRRTDHAGAARASPPLGEAPAAVDPPQPGAEGDLVPGRDVAPVRGRELGLALQHALRRGAREPAAPLLPARDLPVPRRSCSGGRSSGSTLAVAHALPGPAVLPVPRAAPELVPRRRTALSRRGALPALRDQRRPGARRRSRTSSSAACSCG